MVTEAVTIGVSGREPGLLSAQELEPHLGGIPAGDIVERSELGLSRLGND